jgi:hypothetical protein
LAAPPAPSFVQQAAVFALGFTIEAVGFSKARYEALCEDFAVADGGQSRDTAPEAPQRCDCASQGLPAPPHQPLHCGDITAQLVAVSQRRPDMVGNNPIEALGIVLRRKPFAGRALV